MKLSNETKIGILALFAAFILVWGFNFLKGKNLFSTDKIIYAEYDDVSGLYQAAPIYINGLKVGTVSDIYLKEDFSGKIIAKFALDNSVEIPKSTIAVISQPSLTGSKAVSLIFDSKDSCKGSDCAQAGDTLRTGNVGMVSTFLGPDSDIIDQVRTTIGRVDSMLVGAQSGDAIDFNVQESLDQIKLTIANLASITGKLDGVMTRSSKTLLVSFANLEAITENIKANNDKITAILANAETLTANLKDLPLDGFIENTNTTITGVRETLAKANSSFDELTGLINNINEGDGTLPMLINDKKFAEKLNLTIDELQLLLQDIRMEPRRYKNILSGKKRPYKPHPDDPTRDKN